jgi:hypothetical protein
MQPRSGAVPVALAKTAPWPAVVAAYVVFAQQVWRRTGTAHAAIEAHRPAAGGDADSPQVEGSVSPAAGRRC